MTHRATFDGWLDVADQLESELASAPAAAVEPARAEEAPWTPARPDPFGQDWKWLTIDVPPEILHAAIAAREEI